MEEKGCSRSEQHFSDYTQERKRMNMNWTWSNGDVYERSPRIQKQNQQQQYALQQQHQQQQNLHNQHMAQQQSLLSESDPWSLDEFGKQFSNSSSMNKREDTYNKISEREMMGQMGRNPFMMENNYLHDVITQDDFLKPISTTGEREKHHNYE